MSIENVSRSGKLVARCKECSAICHVYIYNDAARPLCKGCYAAEKKVKKSLIKKLPKVADKEAPLGYRFVAGYAYLDETQGKQVANFAYIAPHFGAVN